MITPAKNSERSSNEQSPDSSPLIKKNRSEEKKETLVEMKMSAGRSEENKSNLSSFQNLKVGPDIFIRIKNEKIFEKYTKGRVLGMGKIKI